MSTMPVNPAVDAYIDGEWVDITEDVRLKDTDSGGGINITRGVPNEGNVCEPTEVSLTLNNIGGKYSPRNPYSELFGLLGRNLPIRVSASRIQDDFDRTEVDQWGYLPDWVNTQLDTVPGERWVHLGTQTAFDVSGGVATLQAASGYRIALFGTYGDVDIKVKVKTSVRDSEFGIILRMENPEDYFQDFEDGDDGWSAYNSATVALSTAQARSGVNSMLMTTGSSGDEQQYARVSGLEVVAGRSYRARVWVRCSASTDVYCTVDWFDADFGYLDTYHASVAVTADTWTMVQADGVAPYNAAYASIGPTLHGNPGSGILLYIDDVQLFHLSDIYFATAYVTPGTPDLIRIGRLVPDSTSADSASRTDTIGAGDWWWMRAQMSGIRRRVKMWQDGDPEPADWEIQSQEVGAAARNFTLPATGMIGLFAKDGTSVVSFSDLEINEWRAHAEITELPPRWDLSRRDQWVPIQAHGIRRRLGQGRKNALDSPVTLHLAEYDTSCMWIPLESVDSGSAYAGNRVAGPLARVRSLSQGTVEDSGVGYIPGLAGYAILDQDDSYITARPVPTSINDIWSFLCFLRVPSAPASTVLLYKVNSTGTGTQFLIYLRNDMAFSVEIYNSTGTLLDSDLVFAWFDPDNPVGSFLACNLYVFSSGGTVTWALNYHRPGATTFWTASGTYAGTAGQFAEARFQSSSVLTAAGNLQVAQLFHYPGDLPFVTDAFARAAYAYIGEEAITRFLRLCLNAGIPATTNGDIDESKEMGAQRILPLLDLIDECAEVDDGLITEERDGFQLNMRSRESMYNQVPMVLDIDEGHLVEPLEPTDDDQRTRNDVTVSRPGGSFARSVQESGPLNINAPGDDPDGVGVYEDKPEINVHADLDLLPAANWRRAKGTIDEVRYPSITADLASSVYDGSSAVAAEILAKDAGDMLDIRNVEVGYNPNVQMIQGYTEHLDQYDRILSFVTVPGEVRTVGVVGKSTRLQASNASVDGDFDAGTDVRMSSDISTSYGQVWVQVADSPQSFPFVIEAAGVRLRVRSTGDVLNTNPHFDEGIDGYVASDAALSLFWERQYGNYKSDIPGSMRITVESNTGGSAAVNDQASECAATAGTTYQISLWVKMVGTATVWPLVSWYKSDNTIITSDAPTLDPLVSGEWSHYADEVTAPALTAYARVGVLISATAGDIVYVDDIRFMDPNTYETSPQVLSVDQVPVNSVEKTIPDGSRIKVVDPWRMGF